MDIVARGLTPFGLTLILVVLGQVPLHIPGFAEVAPILPLMAVYHWAIYRSEEHTSELQSQSTISYAVFCLKKKTHTTQQIYH